MPVEGTGFVSGGEVQYIDGRIADQWVNLSGVQIFQVIWEDGDDGELELPALCKYATMWDQLHRTSSTCRPTVASKPSHL